VWPNQPLLAVPDPTSLAVDTRVREVDLHKVSAKQNVVVAVEAYPDLRLTAEVDVIGALAETDQHRAGTKMFPVSVRLRATDPRLRTGMSGRVEIEVAVLPSTVVVPSAAVFSRDGQRVCYIVRHGRPVRMPVVVAGDNGVEAAIGGGVTAGDIVVLVDPTSGS
jgi:HlyD family secretion protein